MTFRVGLSALWFISSILAAIPGWGLVAGLSAALRTSSLLESLAMLIGSAVYLSLFAVIVVAMLSPPYAVALLVWPWVVRWQPWLERRRTGLMVAAIGMAVPAALAVATSRAYDGGAVEWGEFAEWFTMATVTGACAILAPRLIWRSLAPGAFLERTA